MYSLWRYRDKAKDKIAIGHFSSNDLALFLPTRNYTAVVRPWAAFNVNFPHYFLKTSTKLSEYLLTREYHLARITSISEKTVTADKEVRLSLPVIPPRRLGAD